MKEKNKGLKLEYVGVGRVLEPDSRRRPLTLYNVYVETLKVEERARQAKSRGQHPGRGNSKCKGQGVGKSSAYWKKRRKASAADERQQGREK